MYYDSQPVALLLFIASVHGAPITLGQTVTRPSISHNTLTSYGSNTQRNNIKYTVEKNISSSLLSSTFAESSVQIRSSRNADNDHYIDKSLNKFSSSLTSHNISDASKPNCQSCVNGKLRIKVGKTPGFICSKGFPHVHPTTDVCRVYFSVPVTILFHEFYVEYQNVVSAAYVISFLMN